MLPVGLLLLAGMLTAGGCAAKSDLAKAHDLNRKSNDLRMEAEARARRLEGEKKSMQDQLAILQAQARKAENDAAALAAARADLQTRFDKLAEELKNQKTTAPVMPELISMLPTRVNKALQAFAAANPGLVEYDSRHGMVKIKSDLTFALGSTTATQSAVAALTKLVGIINDPVIAGYHVYIAGHTDNVRIRKPETKKRHPDNWYLSVHRAVAIKKVMQTAGLAPARIGVMGFGEYHPVATNKARGGNVRNRRVEIWIVPPDRFLTSSSGGAAAVVDEK